MSEQTANIISAQPSTNLHLVAANKTILTVSLDGVVTLGEGMTLEDAKAANEAGAAGAYIGMCRALLRLYEIEQGVRP